MELKKHLDFRKVFAILYSVIFAIYIIVGLQPAEAANYKVDAKLEIPSIGLDSDVTALKLEDHRLDTPDTIVGSYAGAKNKTLLIGHSTTVFSELNKMRVGDVVIYNGKTYRAISRVFRAKEEIKMTELLKEEKNDTLVLMTCAGELLEGGDATHRLIITAEKD